MKIFRLILLIGFFLIAHIWAKPVGAIEPVYSWSKRLGGASLDRGYSVAIGSNGNVVTAGYVLGNADLNGDGDSTDGGAESSTGYGLNDTIITVFNSSGTYQWSKRLGNGSNDLAYSVATNSLGDIVVLGFVTGNADLNGDGDSTDGGAESSSGYGGDDIFITVFNSSGTYQWSKRLGGISSEEPRHVTIDDSNNIILTGYVSGNADLNGDGDSTDGGAESSSGYGGIDIFISVFNSSGTYQWSKRLGGTNNDVGISLDARSDLLILSGQVSGNADLNGDGDSTDGDAESSTGYGGNDIFVSAFNSSGTYQWSKRLGGINSEFGGYVVIGNSGNLTIGATTDGNADLNGDGDSTDGGAESSTGYGGFDIVLTTFNSSGTYQWSKRLGGISTDFSSETSIDSNNNIYLSGYISGNADLNGDGDSTDGGAESSTGYGGLDAVVTTFNSSGTYQWSRRLGGTNTDVALDVRVSTGGIVAIVGYVDGDADLNGDGDSTDGGAESSTGYGSFDMYVSIFTIADTTAPTISLSVLSPDPHTDNTPTFTGTVTDASGTVSSVQFQMDGTSGSWSSCTSDDGTFDEASEAFTCTVSSTLSDASHTVYVRSTDNSNNTSGNSTDTFIIDSSGPSMTISALSPDPTTDTTPTFTGTATDGASTISSVEYQIDSTSGSWSSCTASDGTFDETSETYSCTTPILTQGTHTIYVRGTDSISNVTTVATYATDAFTIDLLGPSISLNAVSPDPTTDRTPSVTGSVSDGGLPIDYVQYQIDSTSGTWVDCTAQDGTFNELSEDFTCTLTNNLTEAEHTVYIRSADTSGNSSETSDSFTIETTPSYINADYPTQDLYIRQQRPTFKFRASSGSTSQFSSYSLSVKHIDTVTGETTTDFTISDIPVNAPSLSTPNYTITSTGYSDTNPDNDYIYITTKSSSAWDSNANNGLLKEGKNNWSMVAYETTGNTLSVGHDFFVDITNPQINSLSTNSLGIYEDYLLSTQISPRIFFTLSDNLLPYNYTVSIYRQNFFLGLETSRSLVLSETVIPVYTIGLQSIPVTYVPKQTLPYGKYLLILTGFDKAENSSTTELFRLQLLTADKAEELLKKQVEDAGKGVISLPELEKKAILRRRREAKALEKFIRSVKKMANSVDTSLLSLVSDLSKPISNTANSPRQLLSFLISNIDDNITYLVELSGVDKLSDKIKSPSLSDRVISARQNQQKEVMINIPKFTLNQDKVESRFKQEHLATNKKVITAFNATNVAIHSMSQPVEDIKDVTQRLVAGAETFYAIVFDKEPTKISNVTIEEIGVDYVDISWETNHPSTGKVNYGTNLSYGQEVHLDKYEKTHNARLTGLTPGKIYFFEVMSHGKNYTYDSFYTVETRIEEKD